MSNFWDDEGRELMSRVDELANLEAERDAAKADARRTIDELSARLGGLVATLAAERDDLRAQLKHERSVSQDIATNYGEENNLLLAEIADLRRKFATTQAVGEWQPCEEGTYTIGSGEVEIMEDNTIGIMGADEVGEDAYATLALGEDHAFCRRVPQATNDELTE